MTCRPLPLTLGLALALLSSGAVAQANPVAQPPAPPPAAPAPAAGDTAVEIVFWESVRDGDAAGFEAYLQQYPKGAFAPLAHAALRRIEQAGKTAERQAAPLQTQFDTLVEKDGVLVGRDCPECPLMVVVPAGSYRMGSPSCEQGRRDFEGPVHEVTTGAPLAVGRYEVTFAEWDACARDGGCPRGEGIAGDRGWGRGRRPVINVSWHNAKRYVNWLSQKTRKPYRLLSESEWEYAARAGTETAYSWGDETGVNRANCDGCGSQWDDSKTAPAGSFGANAWGLHDMHGNVYEWVEDCWNDSYAGAPADGSAWLRGDCDRRVMRGGSWLTLPSFLRAAYRFWFTSGFRLDSLGFRVARTLAP